MIADVGSEVFHSQSQVFTYCECQPKLRFQPDRRLGSAEGPEPTVPFRKVPFRHAVKVDLSRSLSVLCETFLITWCRDRRSAVTGNGWSTALKRNFSRRYSSLDDSPSVSGLADFLRLARFNGDGFSRSAAAARASKILRTDSSSTSMGKGLRK